MNELYIYEEIGQAIRQRRKHLKLTQEKVAIQIDISRAALANIESGRQRLLVHKLYEICSVLEMKLEDVLPKLDDANQRIASEGLLLPKEDLNIRQQNQILKMLQAGIKNIK